MRMTDEPPNGCFVVAEVADENIAWILAIILEEMDALLDRRDSAAGRAPATMVARAAGCSAMAEALLKGWRISPDKAAKIRELGEDIVRGFIRERLAEVSLRLAPRNPVLQ